MFSFASADVFQSVILRLLSFGRGGVYRSSMPLYHLLLSFSLIANIRPPFIDDGRYRI